MNYWKWKLQWQMWIGNKGTYRALEDVDSMGENGRAWGIEGLAREPQGLEGPICKSNNLGEACWNSSCQAHSLSLSLFYNVQQTETNTTNQTHSVLASQFTSQFEALVVVPVRCRFTVAFLDAIAADLYWTRGCCQFQL